MKMEDFKAICCTNIFGLANGSDDELVEKVEAPRVDYGPIGPPKTKAAVGSSGRLMYSWVSDYIEKGGKLVGGGQIDLRGLVPTFPRKGSISVPMMSEIKIKPGSVFDINREWKPYFVPEKDEEEEKGGKGLSGKELGGNELGGKGLIGEELGGKELGGKGLSGKELGGNELGGKEKGGKGLIGKELGGKELGGKGLSGKELGGKGLGGTKKNGTYEDVKEFAERFGYDLDSVRPGLLMRPRKGKYFKKF